MALEKIKEFYKRHITLFNFLFLLLFIYLFLFSLELMGSSLKLFGKGFAKNLIETTSNPLVGLFIGVLATSIVQSSSSTTSIVVGLVAGGAINITNAIPIIMGANIGTSVTNLIVSMTQAKRSIEFERALSAAIVHDFFNVLAVAVLFPLQYFTNFLGYAATFMGKTFQNIGGLKFLSPVKALTQPAVDVLIKFLGHYPWILLIMSLGFLLLALSRMVKSLKILVVHKAEVWFDKYIFKTAFRAFLLGMILTSLVQSSSIITSLAVPMAGAGLLTIAQIFPYTLGSNIGTTVTAILAALVTGNLAAIIVAFSHLLFNIMGIAVWWPFRFIPISMANKFATFSAKKKYIPVVYILIVFFVIPILIIYLFR
ncbi:MAG TPA: Na/Pi symporter [Acidobacteriota bacterium]|nr:Na/Pi symporter [Acidobacteriota bacterium]